MWRALTTLMAIIGSTKKLVWVMVCAGATGVLLYQVISLIIVYFNREISVQTEWIHNHKLDFPAVTLCNTNPVKKSMLGLSLRISALLARWGVSNNNQASRRRKRSVPSICTTPVMSLTGHCYWIDDQELKGDWAKNKCNLLGGELAKINSFEVEQFFWTHGIFCCSDDLYIGLSDSVTEGTWIWEDGTSLNASWNNWKPGNSNSDGKDCVYYDKDLTQWRTNDCNAKMFSICQYSVVTPAGTTSSPVQSTLVETSTAIPTSDILNLVDTTTISPNVPLTTIDTGAISTTKLTIVDTSSAISTSDTLSFVDTTGISTSDIDHASSTIGLIVTKQETTISPNVPLTLIDTGAISTTKLTTVDTSSAISTSDTLSFVDTTGISSSDIDHTSNNIGLIVTKQETTILPNVLLTTTDTATTKLTTVEQVTIPPPTSTYTERSESLREDFKKETDFIESFSSEDETIKMQMGYQFSEFILECKFHGKDCYQDDFGHFFDAVYGNCYVFNAGWNWDINKKLYKTATGGSSFGVSLVVNLNQAEYLVGIGESAGVIAVVHPQSRMPFPADEGMYILPGHLTSIAIKEEHVSRLSGDYGICQDTSVPDTDRNVFQEYYPVAYSTAACYKTCYQNRVISQCNCADPQLPMNGTGFKPYSGLPCDNRNINEDLCMYDVEQQYARNELQCDCPQPCSEYSFQTKLSKAIWPTDQSRKNIYDKFNSSIVLEGNVTIEDYISKNLVKLEVYFEELNIRTTTETPKYVVEQFWSNVGATFCLWLGCSLVTIFEFIEYFLDIIYVAVLLLRNSNTKQKQKNDLQHKSKNVIHSCSKTEISKSVPHWNYDNLDIKNYRKASDDLTLKSNIHSVNNNSSYENSMILTRPAINRIKVEAASQEQLEGNLAKIQSRKENTPFSKLKLHDFNNDSDCDSRASIVNPSLFDVNENDSVYTDVSNSDIKDIEIIDIMTVEEVGNDIWTTSSDTKIHSKSEFQPYISDNDVVDHGKHEKRVKDINGEVALNEEKYLPLFRKREIKVTDDISDMQHSKRKLSLSEVSSSPKEKSNYLQFVWGEEKTYARNRIAKQEHFKHRHSMNDAFFSQDQSDSIEKSNKSDKKVSLNLDSPAKAKNFKNIRRRKLDPSEWTDFHFI